MIAPNSDRSDLSVMPPSLGSDAPGTPPRLRWLYPIALTTMIVFASGRGQVAGPDIVNIDKVVHFFVFGLIATLVLRSLRGTAQHKAWLAIALVSLFGATDEFRQSFTPGRFMSLADWIADTAGAIVAVAAYSLWPAYRGLLETRLSWPRVRRRHTPARTPPATTPYLPSATIPETPPASTTRRAT